MRRQGLVAAVAVVATLLASCGSEKADKDSAAGGLDAITVTGEPNTLPTVTFSERVEVTATDSDVITAGDGETVEDGDRVQAHITVANGSFQVVTFSTYENDGPAEIIDVDEAALPKGLYAALAGRSVGSRVVVVSPPKDAFGEAGNGGIGIGAEDSVIFVVDIVGTVSTEPSGEEVEPWPWAPAVVFTEDVPTSLDFTGTPEPTGKLQLTYFVRGDGEVVEAGDTVTVNYLGQVFQGDQPFDSSFTSGQPFDVQDVGNATVIDGWNQALVGLKVGSRVMIAIPPELGYGKAGNAGAGIKGTDTLYFLVDVLYVS